MGTENLQVQQNSDPKKIAEDIINAIPPDSDHVALAGRLKKVCEVLGDVDEVTAGVFITVKIKPRFRLTGKEVQLYQGFTSRCRRDKQEALRLQMPKEKERVCCASFPGLVDIAEQNGKPVFLVKMPRSISVRQEFDDGDVILIPPPMENLPYLLPRAEKVLEYYARYKEDSRTDVDRELFDDLVSYHRQCADLHDRPAYDLLAAWVLHTYQIENAGHSPLIWLYGPPERGKSRIGKAMTWVAYRGVILGTLNEANLIRMATDLKASLFFDASDLEKKLRQEHSLDLFLQRVERGVAVSRVLHPTLGAFEDTSYFSVFGATVVATNSPLKEGLETRAICIAMLPTLQVFNDDVTPEAALPLKERCVAFRARHLGSALPSYLKKFEDRLGDITRPIFQIIHMIRPDREVQLYEFIGRVVTQQRLANADSREVAIAQALLDAAGHVDKGLVGIMKITEMASDGEKLRVDPGFVGRKLHEWGFRTRRCGTRGETALQYDVILAKEIARRFELLAKPHESWEAFEERAKKGQVSPEEAVGKLKYLDLYESSPSSRASSEEESVG